MRSASVASSTVESLTLWSVLSGPRSVAVRKAATAQGVD